MANNKHFDDLKAAVGRKDTTATTGTTAALKELAKTDPRGAEALLDGALQAGAARLAKRTN